MFEVAGPRKGVAHGLQRELVIKQEVLSEDTHKVRSQRRHKRSIRRTRGRETGSALEGDEALELTKANYGRDEWWLLLEPSAA